MKFHLPVKLFWALMATMSVSAVYAEKSWMDTIDAIIADETPILESDSSAPIPPIPYAIAKDGSGTLNVIGDVTKYATLYVREGDVRVGDGVTATKFVLSATATPGTAEDGYQRFTSMGVAGRDAVITFDNAAYESTAESAYFVGGIDGNGTMNITNGATVDMAYGNVFVIGDQSVEESTLEDGSVDMWNNATTAEIGAAAIAANRYVGNYTTRVVNGKTYTFGHGIVNVDGGEDNKATYFKASYGNFWMSDGELNVSGTNTKVDLATLGYGLKLGLGEGATSSINVKNGAQIVGRFNVGYICYGDDSTTHIKLDNGARFDIYSQQYIDGNSVEHTPTMSFGFHSMGGHAIIELTKNSSLNLISSENVKRMVTALSWDDHSADSKATIRIDETSSMSADIVNAFKGTVIENAGTLTMKDFSMYGGAITNAGTLSVGIMEMIPGTSSCTPTLTLKGANAVVKVDQFDAYGGSTICLSTGNRDQALIEVNDGATNGYVYLDDGVDVRVELPGKDSLDANNPISILFADVETDYNGATIGCDDLGVQWTSNLSWEERDGKTWITGTIDAVENVVVDAETELSEDISDVDDTTSRTLTVTSDTTISGDNTHSGGTTISDADVTLGSATALGNGVVTTSGTSSITTEDGVAAVLKQSISNTEGTLTLNGSYDVTALETQDVDPTWLNSDLESGKNGFYQDKGSSVQVVENGEDGVLSPDSDATIKHGNREYILNTDTGMAIAPGKIDWSVYHMNTSDHEAKVSEIIEASKDAQGDALLQKIQMYAGTLGVNQSVYLMAEATNENGEIVARRVINVSGDDTELSGMIDCATMHASGGKISATLHGDTSLTVTGDVEIGGDSSQTGDTIITGPDAKLTISKDKDTALGASTVKLQNQATLDLNGVAANNMIEVTGCTVANAENYVGRMEVASHMTFVGTASAGCISLRDKGAINAESLSTTTLEALSDKGADRYNEHTITGDVTIKDSGAIILYSGKQITLTRGSLTLGNGVAMVLLDAGGEFAVGDILVTCTSGTITGDFSELDFLINNEEQEGYRVEISEDRKSVVLAEEDKPIVGPEEDEEDKPIVDPGEDEEDKPIVGPEEDEEDKPIVGPDVPVQPDPAPVFEQTTADVLAQGNWGVVSASRAFVGAVQGQRNNMGCIANGRGTAWASLLGGMTDISGSGAAAGSDITLFGAAVGVDMKVGKRSSLGVAFGYTDGEVSADGLGDIDQEGGHIALYGEHGLKKFANNSCLSLDWVAATGTTESKYMGAKWEQDSVQLNTRLTWNKQVTDRFSYNVFGGLEYFASESDRVENCKSGSIQNLRGELGVGVRYVAGKGAQPITDGKCAPAPACERVVLYGEVSYINDMVRNNPSIEVNGLRGSGANPGRQGVGVEAGATIRLGEKWSASANYSFNAMDDANEHVLNIGASRTF